MGPERLRKEIVKDSNRRVKEIGNYGELLGDYWKSILDLIPLLCGDYSKRDYLSRTSKMQEVL